MKRVKVKLIIQNSICAATYRPFSVGKVMFKQSGSGDSDPRSAYSVRRLIPLRFRLPDRAGVMTWGGSGYARIGMNIVEAVAGGIVLGGVRLVWDGQLQLAIEGIKQILVGAEVGDVVAEVVEQRGTIAVHPLHVGQHGVVKFLRLVDVPHNRSQRIEFAAVGHGDGTTGRSVMAVEIEEGLAEGGVIDGADEVAGAEVIGEAVNHDFRRTADEVVGYIFEVVGGFDGRHEAVVEHDVLHPHPRVTDGIGQRRGLNLIFARPTAEPPRLRHIISLEVVLAPCPARADGKPAHSVTAHNERVAAGGGDGPHIVEHRRDVLALREVGLVVEHQRVADASVLFLP